MNETPNLTLEQRVAALETKTEDILKSLQSIKVCLNFLGDGLENFSAILLLIANREIVVKKNLIQGSPGMDDAERQESLRRIAKLETLAERIEAAVSPLKNPPQNAPDKTPGV